MTYAPQMETVDEYIASCSAEIRPVLEEVRAAIRAELPDGAVECISYQMPTYRVNGTNAVHFAAAKAHVGLYPTPDAVTEFAPKLSRYKTSKGAIQFPFEEPMPLDLIREITAFRVAQLSG